LVVIGLGDLPKREQLLERPFARPETNRHPHQRVWSRSGAGRALFCAGPVLAAIVAGATAHRSAVVVLTVAFAVGTAVPLLFFAGWSARCQRVSAFRHQRQIRITAGL
jgi:hypothetical protein